MYATQTMVVLAYNKMRDAWDALSERSQKILGKQSITDKTKAITGGGNRMVPIKKQTQKR